MARLIARPAAAADTPALTRRDEIALAFFGTWTLFGLYLDGWAHRMSKPESFFTPWHGVLYSGFSAAVAWFAIDGFRQRGRVDPRPEDRLAGLGLAIFIAGAVGDFVWHEIFGVEVDLEALLSPTHLSLMIGGILMLSGGLRSAAVRLGPEPSFREFLPTLVALILTTGVVTFFFMYLSAWNVWELPGGSGDTVEFGQVYGIAGILTSNLLLLAPAMVAVRRWLTPPGALTVLFAVTALAMTGLDGFDRWQLVLPAAAGGALADVCVRRWRPAPGRPGPARVIGLAVPVVTWTGYLAVMDVLVGVRWGPELSSGSVILAAMTGLGLSVLVFPGPRFVRSSDTRVPAA